MANNHPFFILIEGYFLKVKPMNNNNFEVAGGWEQDDVYFSKDSVEEQLQTFMLNYPSIQVTKYDDFLTYKTRIGYADMEAEKAKELIEKLRLNLEAKSNSIGRLFSDSFVVCKSCKKM